jgi:O-methyltransferase involved in polyketide biosynthesis
VKHEFDPGTPSAARIYDHLLGGTDNFAADRTAACQLMSLSPGAAAAARDNRRFLKRAVTLAANLGVTQFLDIGAGIPAQENTHETAARTDWMSRVVYVDNDPLAVYQRAAILGGAPQAVVIEGDLREPQQITGNPAVRDFLDMRRPVAVILAAVLHFVEDAQAYAVVDYLKDVVPRESVLVISHATADDATSAETEKVRAVYEKANTPVFPRSRAEVARFFDGLDVTEPGVVDVNAWRPEEPAGRSQTIGYGAVAVKP